MKSIMLFCLLFISYVLAFDDRITVTLPKKNGKYETLDKFCSDWKKSCAKISCDIGNELCEAAPHNTHQAQVYCARRSCNAPYYMVYNWSNDVVKALNATSA